ncbi:MAG: ABC transporter permease [Pseudomonadota bacterium]
MKRLRFIVQRLLQAIPVILSIIVINFILIQMMGGDVVDILVSDAGGASEDYIENLRARYGLDQPWYIQLLAYMRNVLVLDLGYSFRFDVPVTELILDRLGPTLILMITTLIVSVGVGCLLGFLAAINLNTWRDWLISVFALVSYATPLFWAGLMFIVVFAIRLGWVPTSGMETIGAFYEGWDRVKDIAWHLILPAGTLSLFYLAFYTRMMRATMLEQADMDYAVTARAKGLTERQITFRHVLRNALLPIVTVVGLQTGGLLGGSVIVESVFGWPGLGLLAYDSLFARDLNLLLGIFFISACLVVVVNIAIDTLYTFLDPRIHDD